MPTLDEEGSARSSNESVPLGSPLLWNCFNDFPTSCFIFMSSVLSVYCRGLPGSENDQLCMTLNMYICAFVYSVGVHWYFFFSSQWFTKKGKAPSLTCKGAWRHWAWTTLMNMTHRWHPVWHHCKSPFHPCPSANQYSFLLPPSLQGHFLWHLWVC